MDTHSIAVATFNVNGLGNYNKRTRVFEWLKQKKEKIIFLQETHSTPEIEITWRREWGGDIIYSHGQSNSTGVAILLGPEYSIDNIGNIQRDTGGRFLAVDLNTNNMTYCLANYYGPNTDTIGTLEQFISVLINRPPRTNYIIGGDWNAVLSNDLDKGGAGAHKNKKCGSLIKEAMEELGLIDIFRTKNPSSRKYSHFNKTSKSCSRLDYFLISSSLTTISSSNIDHGYASDHSYVNLQIVGEDLVKQGRGYWKINNSYIKEPEYETGIQEIIDYNYSNNFDSVGGVWDVIKIKIKEFSIKYGAKRKKGERESKIELLQNIETTKLLISELQDNINTNMEREKEELYDNLKELESKYNQILKTELDGIITRAKVQWVEEGEKSTRYFMGLEKSKGTKRSITKLLTEEKQEIKDQEGISMETVKFYNKLFSSRNIQNRKISEYLSVSDNLKVPGEVDEKINRPIEIGELDTGLKNFYNNKSPGIDGLSSEFYTNFWDRIKPILFKVYEESINRGALSPSQRTGIIVLIPKPEKDHDQLKNWRPITLLNVDYKLFTHIIKNRINQAIPYIITKQQTGFQKGKGTNVNLTLMYLVLEYYHRNPDEGGYILQVDFEKAFDSVEHNFLFQTLENVGFGQYLIKLVKTAFAGCMSMILVNGNLTEQVYLQRGLHQGSPLSPLLFIIVGQVLTNRCYSNKNIRGLCIEGVEIMMSLFADDTDTFLEANPRVLKAFIQEVKMFGEVSGCKCNIDKTVCVLLGNAEGAHHNYEEILAIGDIKIENEFKALGVHFNARDFKSIIQLNYEKKILKAEELTKQWGKRDLTVYGKVAIIKSFILSQFIYLFVPLARPPSAIIRRIESIIYNFLWGVKRDKVKREITTCSRDRGGLDMINVQDFIRSQKSKLIASLLDHSCEQEWKEIIIQQLSGKIPLISIENTLVKDGCGFSKDLLQAAGEALDAIASSSLQVRNRCIWNSPIITDMGRALHSTHLIERDILYVSDFLDEEGELLNHSRFIAKHNISRTEISQKEFGNIKLAIKRRHRSLKDIGTKINVELLQGNVRHGKWQSLTIRMKMKPALKPSDFVQLKKWELRLEKEVDWYQAFFNIYDTTMINKLREFQYKCNYRLCTSRYMRKIMNIERETDQCHACKLEVETLEHQLISCSVTVTFKTELEHKIKVEIPDYKEDIASFVTATHNNKVVNYLNIIAKYYINKKFRQQKLLWWEEYAWYARNFILYDKLEEPDRSMLIKITNKGEQLQNRSGT